MSGTFFPPWVHPAVFVAVGLYITLMLFGWAPTSAYFERNRKWFVVGGPLLLALGIWQALALMFDW
jgi:hypothetical protein